MADPDRIGAWFRRNMPSREQIAGHRFSRPFRSHLKRDELWRFTRRSVPRGVAVGLFVGILFLIPGVQIVGAAIFSLPVRANVLVAGGMTFLTNPLTTPFLLVAAGEVGSLFGFGADIATVRAMISRGFEPEIWMNWLLSDAALGILTGLAVLAAASAALGYLISILVWRWWTGRKWRRRGQRDEAQV
ncbi:MAG TPA: DUF2062 domain-containing protein [Allosphingosinicella sp.]